MFTQPSQIHGVIAHLQRTEAAVGNGLLAIREALDAELDQSMDAVQRETASRDGELRDHLRYVLAGSTRGRWLGVILLSLGIVLAVAGSVLGAVA